MVKTFIIAEAGVNHNGSLDQAIKLIDAAKEAGADAVKFQTFKAENVVSKRAPKAEYQKAATGNKESQLEMIKKLELSFDDFRQLNAHCKKRNILFLSTPFDDESVDFLATLEMSYFKVPSGEITNFPFLEKIAKKNVAMIVSTGMSDLKEVEEAVRVIKKTGNEKITLLQCVSNYPADPKDANLKAMETMRRHFNLPVGFSDHTLGIQVSLAAVALGAQIIEKHFTLDKNLPGPDHQASLNPSELKELVDGIRLVESALGMGEKKPVLSEKPIADVARKSLVAAQPIAKGTVLTSGMIAVKRPGTGLAPSQMSILIGLKTVTDIEEDTLFAMEMFKS